jgi:hypothetical protein
LVETHNPPSAWLNLKEGRLTSISVVDLGFREQFQNTMAVIFVVASLSIVAQQSVDTSVGMIRSAKSKLILFQARNTGILAALLTLDR